MSQQTAIQGHEKTHSFGFGTLTGPEAEAISRAMPVALCVRNPFPV